MDYEEGHDSRLYMCKHPNNEEHSCELDNKWGDTEAECEYLNAVD